MLHTTIYRCRLGQSWSDRGTCKLMPPWRQRQSKEKADTFASISILVHHVDAPILSPTAVSLAQAVSSTQGPGSPLIGECDFPGHLYFSTFLGEECFRFLFLLCLLQRLQFLLVWSKMDGRRRLVGGEGLKFSLVALVDIIETLAGGRNDHG